jgi:hypothetical protein
MREMSDVCEAAITLKQARRQQAVREWLRQALCDSTTTLETQCPKQSNTVLQASTAAVTKVWWFATHLQTVEAVNSALLSNGQNAYMATLLAQPVFNIQHDMQRQVHGWRTSSSDEMASNADSEGLGKRSIARLFLLLAGEIDVVSNELQSGLQSVYGWQGEWMRSYAVALGYSPNRMTGAPSTPRFQ